MTLALLPPPQDDEEARLLAAIQANPDDDGLRLVYADCLLSRGDPRGELYAIQTALARGVGPWRRFVLEQRVSDLHFASPRPSRGMPIYRRGAPDGCRIDPHEIEDELPAHLVLMTWSTTSKADAARGFAHLRMHPRAADVRELDLAQMHGWGWDALLDGMLRPRRLVLPRCAGHDLPPHGWLSTDAAGALAAAPLCERVEQLELSAAVGDAALAVLATAPWIANVTSLVAGGTSTYGTIHGLGHVGYANGPLSDAGVQTIARHMPAVRRLDLRRNRITADGVHALAQSPLVLDELQLSLDGLGVAGLAALARSRLASVARVSPNHHLATEAAAYRTLVESSMWAERWIDLWVEHGGDIGPILDAIASASGSAAPIEELRIRGAMLAADQLERVLASPAMAGLKRLALVEIQAPPTVLARATRRPLEGLFVMRWTVGPAGLEAALASPHAEALELVCFEECKLGDAGVRLLARSALRPLDLDLVDQTELATQLELLASPVLERTERLRLFLRKQFTPFDSAAVRRVLVESPSLAAIRQICLQGLEELSDDDKPALVSRFGAALTHPRV